MHTIILSVEVGLAAPLKALEKILSAVVPRISTMVAPFKALENMDMSLEELYSHVGITGKSNSIKKDPLSNSGVSETLLAVRIPACVANSISSEPTKTFEKIL